MFGALGDEALKAINCEDEEQQIEMNDDKMSDQMELNIVMETPAP